MPRRPEGAGYPGVLFNFERVVALCGGWLRSVEVVEPPVVVEPFTVDGPGLSVDLSRVEDHAEGLVVPAPSGHALEVSNLFDVRVSPVGCSTSGDICSTAARRSSLQAGIRVINTVLGAQSCCFVPVDFSSSSRTSNSTTSLLSLTFPLKYLVPSRLSGSSA